MGPDFYARGDRVSLAGPGPHSDKARRICHLMNHQEGHCSICGQPINLNAKIGKRKGATLEHVWPLNLMKRLADDPLLRRRWLAWREREGEWNKTVAHGQCNSFKGNRWPTGCELVWLMAVNARSGFVAPAAGRLAESVINVAA